METVALPDPVELLVNENVDRFNRRIDYLRVAVTDRCNLRCFYCMPEGRIPLYRHSEILRYEEILHVIRAAVSVGITKVRITGGEPLIRRDICELVRQISQIPQIADLAMTTNGIFLDKMAAPLFDAGLKRINVSLDTLNPLTFFKITRCNRFEDVWKGLNRAASVGFHPIKINTVVVRNVNDMEIGSLARMSMGKAYNIRFIEFMPIGYLGQWQPDRFVSSNEMKKEIERIAPLIPVPRASMDGPADRYHFPASQGEIGFIGAVSQHFCSFCNRLRLTPDGKLRPCLMSDEEIDLKTPLRNGCTQTHLERLFHEAIASKPGRWSTPICEQSTTTRMMSRIGG